MKLLKTKLLKVTALVVAFSMLFEVIFPTTLLALTAGPSSPEFSTFTPVASTDMVNLATGDFQYNIPVLEIPGANGGGYALSLSYNSGISSEQEASWVGLGWTLNPGSINRSTRGFPDDYNNIPVKTYNKTRPNWTASSVIYASKEIFGKDDEGGDGGLSASTSLRFNNYKGYHSSVGFGISLKGLSFNMNLDEEGVTYDVSVNFMAMLMSYLEKDKSNKEKPENKTSYANQLESLFTNIDLNLKKIILKSLYKGALDIAGSSYGTNMFADQFYSTSVSEYSGIAFNLTVSEQINPAPIPTGFEIGAQAGFNLQYSLYKRTQNAFGYLYTHDVNDMTYDVMDYYTEKETTYNKRDLFIGMPFANYDIFNVHGEGIAGSFRPFKNKPGKYEINRPRSSGYDIMQAGIEFMAGLDVGIGLDLGKGQNKQIVKDWGTQNLPSGYFFRFSGDMGGVVDYFSDTDLPQDEYVTDPQCASLIRKGNVAGTRYASIIDHTAEELATYTEGEGTETDEIKYIRQSSNIESHTLSQVPSSQNSFDGSFNTQSIPQEVDNESIAEFAVTNEEGTRYVYGQPVYTRNESNLSVDIDPSIHDVDNNYLAFREMELINEGNEYNVSNEMLFGTDYKTVIGNINPDPYAHDYLLTSIVNVNYIDVNDNGIDDEDFGGWTKFEYRKKYGSQSENGNDWYRYRTPYNGLLYNKNSVSTTTDDIGTVVTGEKEVYYLEKIETNTHVAFFVTDGFIDNEEDYNIGNGSLTDLRPDGLGAVRPDGNADAAANGFRSLEKDSNQRLEKLERIVIFSKARPDKPIKVVRFEYDNSLAKNVPNNVNTNFSYDQGESSSAENSGKLTLKKIWFEYEGLSPVKVSPYEFNYEYESSSHFATGSEYFTEYDLLVNSENPDYAPDLLDPWGNVMPLARERKFYDIPWIYQGKLDDIDNDPSYDNWRSQAPSSITDFDPAAWNLKQIILPSGGEIHIQYEQKDYMYVQDRPTMAMVSCLPDDPGNIEGKAVSFNLNLADIGIDATNETMVAELVNKIDEYYGPPKTSQDSSRSKEKIYFKWLYALEGTNPSLTNNLSEYITGYANMSSVDYTRDDITNECTVTIKLGKEDGGDFAFIPKEACYDFYIAERNGLLTYSGGVPDMVGLFDNAVMRYANQFQPGNTQFFENFKGNVAVEAMKKMIDNPRMKAVIPFAGSVCKRWNPYQSYLKIPMITAKKGGGNRVKRVLIYDKGLESGAAVMYGQEYHYVLEDGVTSSGVATNEPTAAREENPLIYYMPRKDQSTFDRLTTGQDKGQTEGPVGESLLPPAGVVYSRVVVNNIHTGKTGTGFTVHEYYTTKDYPFDYLYEDIDKQDMNGNDVKADVTGIGFSWTPLSDNLEKDLLIPVNFGLVAFDASKVWMSQGFRFILNSMNGVQKSVSSYGGSYLGDDGDENTQDTEGGYLISVENYEYFKPGEKVRTLSGWDNNGNLIEKYIVPGKEVEYASEGKTLQDVTVDFNIEFDIGAGFTLLPNVIPTVWPKYSNSTKEIGTYAVTKVINYPVILKKVSSYFEGTLAVKENVAFNTETGKPVITKSYDSYHNITYPDESKHEGAIYSFEIPASWIYPSMGQKVANPANTNQLSATTLTLSTYGDEELANPKQEWFTYDVADKQLSFNNIQHVMGLTAQTFSNNLTAGWQSGEKIDEQYHCNSYMNDFRKVFRPAATYVYDAKSITSTADNEVTESGYFDITNANFDFDGNNGNNWLKTVEITMYSPNGIPLEEKNILGIYSSVLFGQGYNNKMPVMIAQNARYDAIYFNDFENIDAYQASICHSGKKAKYFTQGENLVNNVYGDPDIQEGIIKAWLSYDFIDGMACTVGSETYYFNPVSHNDGWTLIEAEVADLPASGQIAINLSLPSGKNKVILDDVRFQPLKAQAACYAYDPATLRLIAEFDDQHFGTYYQYNEEGKLVSKIVETERGKKTIQETQYVTPKRMNNK